VRFDRLRQAVERARRRRALRSSEDRAAQLEAELEAARAGGQAGGPADDGFWIPERHGQRRVPLEAINWIEAARDYVLLHTDLRSHLLRITMAALEERLAGSQLVRVHRSAFVRPDRVEEVNRDGRSLSLVLAGGAEVQVGPSYVAATKAALGLE
jgi:DNA-binding LytR/AlgR family response regulator